MQLAGRLENFAGGFPNRMEFQSGLVVKPEIVLFFFTKGLEEVFLEQAV